MQIKTVTTGNGVNEISFSNENHHSTAHFYWFRNLGNSVLYVSASPNPIIGGEDVAELPANGAVAIETDEGRVYILGAGKAEIHRTDSKICPFRFASSDSGGGEIKNPEAVEYALRQAGYEVTSDPNTWSDTVRAVYKDYDYRLDYSGTIFVYGGRTVTRDTDKLAYCAYCNYQSGYFLPIIISTDPEAVASTMGGVYAPGPNESIEIDGITIYGLIAGNRSLRTVDSSDYNRRFFGEVGSPNGKDLMMQLYNEIKILGYSLYE